MPKSNRIQLEPRSVRHTIEHYLSELERIRFPVFPRDPVALFQLLKRTPLTGGPYPGTTIFETANRVLSDMIVLSAAESLFRNPLPGIPTSRLRRADVALGVAPGFDIEAWTTTGRKVIGECFNVSRSLFRLKLAKTEIKLGRVKRAHRLVAFNAEAVESPQEFLDESSDSWSYLPVELENWLRWMGNTHSDH